MGTGHSHNSLADILSNRRQSTEYVIALNGEQTREFMSWSINDITHDCFGNTVGPSDITEASIIYSTYLKSINPSNETTIEKHVTQITQQIIQRKAQPNHFESILFAQIPTPTIVNIQNPVAITDSCEHYGLVCLSETSRAATPSVFYDSGAYTTTCGRPEINHIYLSDQDMRHAYLHLHGNYTSAWDKVGSHINVNIYGSRAMRQTVRLYSCAAARVIYPPEYDGISIRYTIRGEIDRVPIILTSRASYAINDTVRGSYQIYTILSARGFHIPVIGSIDRNTSATIARMMRNIRANHASVDSIDIDIINRAILLIMSKQWGDLGLVIDALIMRDTYVVSRDRLVNILCGMWGVAHKLTDRGPIVADTKRHVHFRVYK